MLHEFSTVDFFISSASHSVHAFDERVEKKQPFPLYRKSISNEFRVNQEVLPNCKLFTMFRVSVVINIWVQVVIYNLNLWPLAVL